MDRIAVILLNMGGPDSLDAVRPFLFNLFSDKNMIRLPNPLRYFVAGKISRRREEEAKHIYSEIGGKSPILETTKEQAKELEKLLNERSTTIKVFIAMRYWHPFSSEVIQEVKNYDPDKVILLPLYPQYSTTTSLSSIEDMQKKLSGMKSEVKIICCYPIENKFIEAHVSLIRPYYEQATKFGEPRILFSAHGLPEKIIKSGDPYQWQVEQTADAIVNKLAIKDLDWIVCYQSKVGPLKWIGPSTEEEIIKTAKNKIPLVIVPIAFVSEHSETLVELDIQYKKLAEEKGLQHYFRVPALGTNELYIKSLAKLCTDSISNDKKCMSHTGEKICPKDFSGCMMNKIKNMAC